MCTHSIWGLTSPLKETHPLSLTLSLPRILSLSFLSRSVAFSLKPIISFITRLHARLNYFKNFSIKSRNFFLPPLVRQVFCNDRTPASYIITARRVRHTHRWLEKKGKKIAIGNPEKPGGAPLNDLFLLHFVFLRPSRLLSFDRDAIYNYCKRPARNRILSCTILSSIIKFLIGAR